ncbi:MAG: c-type cytochrome [Gemmatimonadetes bacterium]|nr:c-type cytochrome [Gemmatimonadota bacterium]
MIGRTLGMALACLAAIGPRARAQAPEPTAGETYKNVQVLKDASASSFMSAMFFQRYALGVSCDYCHAESGWEKDDKPAKRKAREMIRMVQELNARQFEGKRAVTCMTCHRGATTPQTDIAAVRQPTDQMIGLRRRQPVARPVVPDTTPAGILARHVAALGGRAAIEKARNTVLTGNLLTSGGAIVPFEESFSASPPRWRYARHFGAGTGDFASGFDGEQAWNSDNRGFTPQQGAARGRMALSAVLQHGQRLDDQYERLAYAGTELNGTRDVVVLTGVARQTGNRERLAFDLVTGLLSRRTIVTEGAHGAYTTDWYYENYTSIDGIMTPTIISEFSPDDGTVRKVRTIEHNVALPANAFEPPAKR